MQKKPLLALAFLTACASASDKPYQMPLARPAWHTLAEATQIAIDGQVAVTVSRANAESAAIYIVFIGGAAVLMIVLVGLAARVAGPALAHLGTLFASRITAHGEAYAAGRNADGQYALKASQGWAAREMARQGGAVAQRRAAIPPAPKPEMSPEIASAVNALKACRDIVGGEARFLPKADELSGSVRAALEPMKGNGLISVTRGRGGGTYLTRHLTLDALITELEACYIALPSPTTSESGERR